MLTSEEARNLGEKLGIIFWAAIIFVIIRELMIWYLKINQLQDSMEKIQKKQEENS